MVMDMHFEKMGYKRISKSKVESLDDTIEKGIDGVYFRENPPPNYVIAEAKYGGAKLNTKSTPKQMTKEWIDKNIKEAVKDEQLVDKIINDKNYTSVLVHIPPASSRSRTSFSELKVDGTKKKFYNIEDKLKGDH
ncbi:MAG: Unknown protein [uncultured Sulfurovum sp.]|uniref:Cytosolic protein n=1 Tax=uncultured Sulfurovum sp. TaxID=269237 RepID=A0A6S6S954_9BACT|nr:MAG: Unknown protein [uncultured Sulfurovum sp.]